MNRPFMFSGVRYDEDHMFYQMKRLRIKILRTAPRLGDSQELKNFYTIEGQITDVRKLRNIDIEFASGDEEADSSDDAESDFGEDINNRSFMAGNATLNEKSEIGGRSVDRVKRTI